ncbi:MAG: S9 family peptidase, partial [Acidobacteriota bacterium]
MVTRIRILAALLLLAAPSAFAQSAPATPAPFTLEQITGYAFPSDLTASSSGDWIAWTSMQRGVRNIWIAKGPDFKPRMLTVARSEDGQELTNLAFSADGRYLVWTRGGDHGSN